MDCRGEVPGEPGNHPAIAGGWTSVCECLGELRPTGGSGTTTWETLTSAWCQRSLLPLTRYVSSEDVLPLGSLSYNVQLIAETFSNALVQSMCN